MRALLEIGLTNAGLATVLALGAAVLSRMCRRPALTHALWLLVLVKLLTPPFLPVTVPWPVRWDPAWHARTSSPTPAGGFTPSPLPGAESSRPVADGPAGPKEESFLGRAPVAPRAAALPETL